MIALFRAHPRIIGSTAAGTVLFFCLPEHWSVVSRVLVSWNCGVALFLCLVYAFMTRLSAEGMQSRYSVEDEAAPIILIVVVFAAVLSVAAIVQPLAAIKHGMQLERAGHIVLAASTLVISWVLVPTMFTTHYANLYYSTADDRQPLVFPATPMPAFWDFAYFSFTIAAACQTSDVCTTNVAVRKIVIAQTLVSFLFNLSILGFAVNVTAGLIGS
ncbi:MAG: DUF1345 domain-containing protein [Pseudomonadota bacterium]|nr:DUF1345 domain-containing protein [Pseudomonadota bacterium]